MLLISELVEEADEPNDIHVGENDDKSTENEECQSQEDEFLPNLLEEEEEEILFGKLYKFMYIFFIAHQF